MIDHIKAIGVVFSYKIKAIAMVLVFFSVANIVCASNLSVTLNGELPNTVKKNIFSYLGKLPDSELERSAFIYSAKSNIQKALQSLGYYQASVALVVKKDPWFLIITIKLPKPTLLDSINVSIVGEAKYDTAFTTLLNNHDLTQGETLHHGKYETLKANLLSLGQQRGYLNGVLTNSNITIKDDYRLADITILYDSGPRFKFGDITFDAFYLTPELFSNLIPFEADSYYSAQKLHKLQYQLQSTQYFSNVITVPAEKIANSTTHQYTVPIQVSLTPAKSHQFDLGIGYATDTEFRLSAGWRTPRINKYGHYQETKLEYSALNPTGKFIYNIPINHPFEDVLRFKLTVENEDYADFTTKFYSAQMGRVTSKNNWNRQIYIRYHKESWDYDLDDIKPNIIWSEKDNIRYIIPGVTWSKTTRKGSALDPSSGFRQTYNIEGAHLNAGSDNSFFRFQGRWRYITTLKPKHRLVTRAELGAIYIDKDAELAPSLRFYAGGDQSIRGFAYQSIGSTIPSSSDPEKAVPIVVGGTRLILASIEYQYYLNDKWRLGLFSDGGSVADQGEFEPVYSLGTGIHYMSPVGAIKFDLAYGIDDDDKSWRLHISLGAEL